jgi:hypothetical protein
MNHIFNEVSLIDFSQDVKRNIVSLAQSQDLFDDLTTDPSEWLLAQKVESDAKPALYKSNKPVIDRPFEQADWFNAITWPFKHWQSSRFSDGTYGVWYGSDSVETTVWESAYHWYNGILSDAGFERQEVVAERKVYLVACQVALLDLTKKTEEYKDLLHPFNYEFAQSVGTRIHKEGHPGLLVQSVRRPVGNNVAIFNPVVLSNPRHCCNLIYRLKQNGQINIERQPGSTWFTIDVAEIS